MRALAERDPAQALADPVMTSLPAALDPHRAREAFARACPALAHRPPIAEVSVIRYRRGRRCLVRYGFADGTGAVIGKLTAKGVHKRGLAVQLRLYAEGFAGDAADGLHVPEPLGAVPSLGLWLQREVAGRPLQTILGEPEGVAACARAADALAKLHRVPAAEARCWTIADELAVLDTRLEQLGHARPDLAPRVRGLRERCHAAAATLPEAAVSGIHRDFYPEQLIVGGDRLHLVDLDLYSRGDPALDAGNFIAHLIEAAIRATGDPAANTPLIEAFRNRFLGKSPATPAAAIRTYTLLSLARLAQISTTIQARNGTTEIILATCEALDGRGSAQR
jgi:hypothetical protein